MYRIFGRYIDIFHPGFTVHSLVIVYLFRTTIENEPNRVSAKTIQKIVVEDFK